MVSYKGIGRLGYLLLVIAVFALAVNLYESYTIKGILLDKLGYSGVYLTRSQTVVYEVKPSEAEAKSWVQIATISRTLGSGEQATGTIMWGKGYESQISLDINVNINPSTYYSCYWYDCVDCVRYSYTYCSQYRCTVTSGTPYAICERDEIRTWKCVKSATEEKVIEKIFIRTGYVRDGPDIFDWGDPDYLEFPINDYPWNDLATDPAQLSMYLMEVILPLAPSTYNCLKQYYNYFPQITIIYEDGTKQNLATAIYMDDNAYTMTIEIWYISVYKKKINRIEFWEVKPYWDISICFPTRDASFSFRLRFLGWKPEAVEDVKYVDKVGKSQLEAQGYVCTPYDRVTTTKTFTNLTSCDVVRYTTNQTQDGTCSRGYCYWYCPSNYECSPSPPRTKQTGTITQTQTYTASDKQTLYSYGCSDSQISCTSWSTKTGTLSDYQNDVLYRDARNPSCSQWGTSTYRSSIDKTKTSGEPPYTQCTYKSDIFETRQSAPLVCQGPNLDSVSKSASITVGQITKSYYSSTTDTITVNVGPNQILSVTLTGAQFAILPLKGTTTFNIVVKALDQNPYIVSQSTQEVTGAAGTALKYVAIIYSPGDLLARFYPQVCSEFEAKGYKYRYATLNGQSIMGDPCAGGGLLYFLNKGNNQFEMIGYTIDPSRFPSCIEKPTTCEEDDLYGCPEQCKVKDLSLECPSSMTISSGLGKDVKIPITITANSPGIVRISTEGEGLVFIPTEYRVGIGTNRITLAATSYIETNQSKSIIWRVIVQNPAARGNLTNVDIKYCEIKVTVVPAGIIEIISRPEIIISIVIIVVGLILMLVLGRK